MTEKFGKRIFWCIAFIVVGGVFYLFTNNNASTSGAVDVQSGFEVYIPFVPWMIVVYYLIFPYLSLPIFLVKKYKDFFKVVIGLWIVTFASAVIFFLFPTTMERPEIVDQGLIGMMFHAMRYVDGPFNMCPSLHVSSITFVAFAIRHFFPKSWFWNIPIAVSICISTLLVKQHAIVDVFCGFLLGFCVFLAVFKVFCKKEIKKA